jgi:Dockerin type I domain/GEVED domain
VTASGPGLLDAWIDFNRDGDWDDAGEQIFTRASLNAGANTLPFTTIASAAVGNTFARFRLSSAGSLLPKGAAADGEVEDYFFTILSGSTTPEVVVNQPSGPVEVNLAATLSVRAGQANLFVAPASSVGSLEVRGTPLDDSFLVKLGDGSVVPVDGIKLRGASGTNLLVVEGNGGELDFTDGSVEATDFSRIDISSEGAVTIRLDAAAVARLAPVLKLLSLSGTQADKVILEDAEDWRLATPVKRDGKLLLTADNIAGGGEQIEADLANAWHNFLRAGDVNNDGSVTALDALRIINELAQRLFSESGSQTLDNPFLLELFPDVYFDHNNDGRVTALDALRVINDIARAALINGSGNEQIVVVSSESPSEDHAVEQSVSSVPQRSRGAHTVRSVTFTKRGELPLPHASSTNEAVEAVVDQLLSDEVFLAELR